VTRDIAKNAVERTSKALLAKVFPSLGKVSVGDAHVRTFRRLENLLAFCTLAYSCFAHVLPDCAEESGRLLKTTRDSLGDIVESFRPFVANVRELPRMERTRLISGRPRKRKPPDLTAPLPGFPP